LHSSPFIIVCSFQCQAGSFRLLGGVLGSAMTELSRRHLLGELRRCLEACAGRLMYSVPFRGQLSAHYFCERELSQLALNWGTEPGELSSDTGCLNVPTELLVVPRGRAWRPEAAATGAGSFESNSLPQAEGLRQAIFTYSLVRLNGLCRGSRLNTHASNTMDVSFDSDLAVSRQANTAPGHQAGEGR
jgi:hypothetical protein